MVGRVEVPSRAYVAAFGFNGSDQQKPVNVLFGGPAMKRPGRFYTGPRGSLPRAFFYDD